MAIFATEITAPDRETAVPVSVDRLAACNKTDHSDETSHLHIYSNSEWCFFSNLELFKISMDGKERALDNVMIGTAVAHGEV